MLTLQSPVRGIFLSPQLDKLCLQALSDVILCLDKRKANVTTHSAVRQGPWSGMCKVGSMAWNVQGRQRVVSKQNSQGRFTLYMGHRLSVTGLSALHHRTPSVP